MVSMNPTTIHRQIRRYKEQHGDPRPDGLTLSLIRCDGPDSYWAGWQMLWGRAYRLRASSDPDDWAWESDADNLGRNDEHNRIYVERGLLVIRPGDSPQWMRREYMGPHPWVSLHDYLRRGVSPLKRDLFQQLIDLEGEATRPHESASAVAGGR